MITNEEILKERTESYNSIHGARVGDFLKLPNGEYTRFTEEWDDSLQTGGTNSSRGYYLGNGFCEYSGSLDSGVQKADILPTDEKKKGFIWFFKNNQAIAHNGAEFEIEFRVFSLREGADLSGLPQMRKTK